MNYPSPFWLEELDTDSKAVALQWLAVSYPGRGAKFSSARGEGQFFALFPAAHGNHTRAMNTDVFRKSRFGTGRLPMAVDQDGYLHRDSLLRPVKRRFGPERHDGDSSSEARGNPREILNAAAAAVLHHVESAVRRTKKFFGSVAIFGKGGNSCADR